MRPIALFALSISGCTTGNQPVPVGDPGLDRAGQADRGEILITEIMADPADCSDSRGEWFELKNLSRETLPLHGLIAVDEDGNDGFITADSPLRPSESIVVGIGTEETFCGPEARAFVTGLSLNNSGESLALFNGELEIDRTPVFTSSEIRSGRSLQLLPSYLWGAFDSSAWYAADRCYNDASETPGLDNGDCVAEHMLHFAVLDSPTPTSDEQKHSVLSASRAWIDGEEVETGFRPLIRTGTSLGGMPFGQLTDENGLPIKAGDGSHFISAYSDFTSVIDQGDNGLWAVTHFEEHPGAMYLTSLEAHEDGTLQAMSTEPVDFSSIGGLWTPCAGSITPWGTHLGSEEYPSDGREFEEVTTVSGLENRAFEYIRYYGFDIFSDEDNDGEPDGYDLDEVLTRFSPYRHGYAVEVTVEPGGTTSVQRHYAMGRRSLELARVMPDQKTVYLTDDGTNVALYMFIADTPGDLSAGRLYAMRWHQVIDAPPEAGVEWIELGWADNDMIQAAVDSGTRFSDLFDTAQPVDDACPEGFRGVNIGEGHECLSVRPGMETLASRLESRRYAGYEGATTELRKEEGLAYDPGSNVLFVSLSAIDSGMSDDFRDFDTGGGNHVRLPYNPCGAVFALPLGSDSDLGSDHVATSMRMLVQGRAAEYEDTSLYAGNHCDVNGIASPDNLTFVEGRNTLVITEDTHRHVNDAIWSMDLTTGRLDRILTTPYGAEATGVWWHENLRGNSYLMAIAQHPYGESDRGELRDPADAAAWVGYLPF